MDLRQVRYALAVAKERSFTRASQRLNVSQSAVSDQVKLLEQELGFMLFRRTGRGAEPTERGRLFLYEAERVSGEWLRLADTARRLGGDYQEYFTIGFGSGMAQAVLPRLRDALASVVGDVRLSVVTAPTRRIYGLLSEEQLDAGVAIAVDPEKIPAGLIWETFAELEMALIMPTDHPLAKTDESIDLAALFDVPVIMNELNVGYGEIITNIFRDLGISPPLASVCDNSDTMVVMVEQGLGCAIVPVPTAAAHAADGRIKVRPIRPALRIPLALIRRRQPMSLKREAIYERLSELETIDLSAVPISGSPITF